jgi:hypothetical protein
MIFGLLCEPTHLRVEAGAFRHRPAFQRALDLEPQIIVQPSRGVLLDNENRLAGARSAALRLVGAIETPFGAVAVEFGHAANCGREAAEVSSLACISARFPRATADQPANRFRLSFKLLINL